MLNINQFKKMFLKIMVIILLITPLFRAEGFEALDDYQLISENKELKLFIQPETTEIAVYVKDSEDIWYSNPPERAQKETIARGRTADLLSSQLNISFYTPGDRRIFLNNYTDSILHDQFEINEIENGVKVDYRLGKKWNEEQYIPIMISEDRMEEVILSRIDNERDREFVKSMFYHTRLIEKPEDYERREIYGIEKEKLFGDYVLFTDEELSDRDLGRFFNNFLGRIVNNREAYSRIGDIRWQDISHLTERNVYVLRDRLSAWDREDLIEMLMEISYNPENVTYDHLENLLDPPLPNIRIFDIPLEYRLKGATLEVTIPASEIEYPVNVIDHTRDNLMVTMPLVTIDVLQFFGAADIDAAGYMFVPDGSGGLINLNNEKTGSLAYDQRLYGRDYAERPRDELRFANEQLYLPVYGLKKGDSAWLAVIEEGDPLARIRADIAGRTVSYNHVYPSFVTIPQARIPLSGHLEDWEQQFINVYQSRLYRDDIRISYRFLSDDKASYTGMAHSYQDYIVDRYNLERLQPQENLPFFLEIMGSFHRQEPVLGVPRRAVNPLTTYQQTAEIIDELLQAGISNISLKYNGWFRGGIEHNYPGKFVLEPVVGEESELIWLNEYLKERDISFYPEIGFQYIYNNNLFDGFSIRGESSRFLSRRTAYLPQYHLANYQQSPGERRYIYSPARLDGLISDFLEGYKQLEIDGLSLKHMGQVLNSDFRYQEDRLVDRPQAMELIGLQLDLLNNQQGLDLMISGGNAYTFPYTDKIIKMPLYATGHDIIDQGVPFMQIALHGYFNFSGQPLNMTENHNDFLKMIETGALPYYRGSYLLSTALKRTPFDDNYSIHYRDWFDEAADSYQQLTEVFAELHHQLIIDHQRLQKGLYITEYEDGTQIIVNYNEHQLEFNGETIAARDYLVLKRGVN